jgi:hypothetical protein
MKCAARLLNIFEKNQGWSLTRVSICDDPNLYKDSINAFAFYSSAKWMQAPQLLSLYLLIIRLGKYWKEFSIFKKVGDLEDMYKIFSKSRVFREQTDSAWFIDTWKYWLPLLNNHKDLFFGKSIEENYTEYTGVHGIKSLLTGYGDEELRKAWKKIAAEAVPHVII